MSSEQVNRYDRQIRAWGFETQRRLQESSAVFVGLNHVSIECMKNLILAGIGEITVVTDETSDSNSNIDILSSLNPNTKFNVLQNCDIFSYDIVCIFDKPELTEEALNSDKVAILVFGISAFLVYQKSDTLIDQTIINADPLIQTICGGLLSHMIVDNLPPLNQPRGIKLEFSAENLNANIVPI